MTKLPGDPIGDGEGMETEGVQISDLTNGKQGFGPPSMSIEFVHHANAPSFGFYE